MTATKAKKPTRDLDRRIKRVLRWLDCEVSPEWIAEYKQCALEQELSVEVALALDEAAMAREGFEAE